MRARHQETFRGLELPERPGHYIAGGWRDGGTDRLPAIDPATGQALTDLPCAGPAEVDDAVAAARAAQRAWRERSAGERAQALEALAARLKQRLERFVALEALDAGMPRVYSQRFSARAMIRHLGYYAQWADKLSGDVLPAGKPAEVLSFTELRPVGVVAAIIPWNTPCLFLGAKVGPALAAGCAIIVKPSEQAALAALEFAAAAHEAGLPAGLVQVLFGDGRTGALLAAHGGIDKLAFTGGGARAREVMATAAGSLKRLALELGGKSPHIVFADADRPRAALLATYGMFSLAGQACAAGSRLLLQDQIHDEFLQQVAQMTGTLVMGDPLDDGTTLGPLIHRAHRARVHGYVQRAVAAGARLVCGGAPCEDFSGGAFYPPTILADIDPAAEAAREEIFGPVLTVFRFQTEDQALALAQDTRYGLAAGLWTRDLARGLRLARALDAGTVWVNGYGQLPIQVPFGGLKESGFGRDGGREGIMEYLEPKTIIVGTA